MFARFLIALLGVASSSVVWSPNYFSDSEMVVWVDPSNTYTMFQESGLAGVGLTESTTNGNKVGQIYDSGPNTLMLYALSDAGRPSLSSDGSMNSYLDFDGTSSVMRFSPSSRLFAGFLSGFTSGAGIQPVFTICMKIKKNADGAVMSLIDNNDHSTTASGFNVYIDASNHVVLRFNSINTPFPVSSIAYTTTEDITVAEGWTNIIIEANQQGTNTGKITINNTEETFNVNGGAGSATVSPELTIGRRATTADRYFNGGLSQFLVVNRILTSTEKNNYKSYNPTRLNTPFVKLNYDYNFNDAARQWADAAKTTYITNGTAIRASENTVRQNFKSQNTSSPNFKDLVTVSTSNTWSVWRNADQNGLSVAEWDGVDDNFNFQEPPPGNGGRFTVFIVAKNDDATLGSHLLYGLQYVVWTGSGYSGNSLVNGNAYMTVHLDNNSNIGAVDLKNGSEGWNVIAIRRDKTAWTIWNGNKVSASFTNSNGFAVTKIGQEYNVGWWMDGKQGRTIWYYGAMSDVQVEAKIDELNALYGL